MAYFWCSAPVLTAALIPVYVIRTCERFVDACERFVDACDRVIRVPEGRRFGVPVPGRLVPEPGLLARGSSPVALPISQDLHSSARRHLARDRLRRLGP